MQNEIITFETAKLANEKEFNISQDSGYELNGKYFDNSQDYDGCKFGYCKEIYLAPTQSLLQRWLREIHKIHLTITSISQESWQCHITKKGDSLGKNYIEDAYTYEQALEEGLYEALKLIKN
jgi:hypothetical protein